MAATEEGDAGRPIPPTTDGFLTLDGTPVHVVRWLPPEAVTSRPRVLLIHGLGGSTALWELVGGTLSTRLGREVVAVDLPGFGRSRAGSDRGTAIGDSARVVGELLQRLGPAWLVASSMGAAVALHTAARSPGSVHSLTLVGAALPIPESTAWFGHIPSRVWVAMLPGIGPLAVWGYARALTAEQIVDDRLESWCVDVSRVHADFRRRLIELATERKSFPEAASAYAHAARSLYRYLTAPGGLDADLTRLDVPILLVHGDRDRVVPVELAREIVRQHPQLSLAVLDDCGHIPHLECPERFVERVVRHLEEGPSSPPRSPQMTQS